MKLYAELAGLKVGDDWPIRVVGVINVSPESFYKGSVSSAESEIVERAVQMVREGADMIDVGAMSTAPYLKAEISKTEEIRRMTTAISAIKNSSKVLISADTKRSEVAEVAIKAGADIINDVGGLKHDKRMARVVSQYRVPLIIMASEVRSVRQGSPIERIFAALRGSLRIAEVADIEPKKIIVDPGIGFFRNTGIPWYEWDCTVIRQISKLRKLGRPIHVGVSRKSFIGKILGQPDPGERLYGSLGAAAILAYEGIHMIRTHDVIETVHTVRIADAIKRGRNRIDPTR